MTTIRLTHSTGGYYLKIDASQVEEDLTKGVASFPYSTPNAKWGSPTAILPRREGLDLLSIQRIFTITGTIYAHSKCNSNWNRTGITAPEARDVLVNMMRYGGVGRFDYGESSEAALGGYVNSDDHMYYTSSEDGSIKKGFPCQFIKYKIVEIARDEQNIPIEYEVTISVEVSFNQGQINYP